MSGGSFDYVSYKIDDIVDRIPDIELRELCQDFSDLLHDIEWYTSGDTGIEDYQTAVRQFKDKWFNTPRDVRLSRILDEQYENYKRQILECLPADYE